MSRDLDLSTIYTEMDKLRRRVESLEVQENAVASITNALLADMAAATLKGRASGAGTGVPTDLTATQAATIIATVADAFSNTNLANMAAATIKGRASGAGTGDPTDLTAAQVATIVGSVAAAFSNTSLANMVAATIKGRASGAGTGVPTDLSAAQVATIVNSSLSHLSLTNIGTNSHATIDTHISATAAHGAAGANVGTTNTQTLDNKTLSKLLLSRTDLTIASGVITVTGSYHRVDTQSAASTDDLDTISGAATGQIVILHSVATARTVVVKHGTGNLYLDGSINFSLNNSRDCIVFLCTGGELSEIGRGNDS